MSQDGEASAEVVGRADPDLLSDIWWTILGFVNVIDSSRLACTSQRMYYLVHQYRRQTRPQAVAVSRGEDMDENDSVWKTALMRMHHPPDLIYSVSKLYSPPQSQVPGTVVGAVAQDTHPSNCTESLLCWSWSESTVVLPFSGENPQDLENIPAHPNIRLVMVHATNGHDEIGFLQTWISTLQRQHPQAIIVGGICNGGYIQQQQQQVRRIQSGVWGVALAGDDIPVRSVVSRGVVSLLETPRTELSPWMVEEARLAHAGAHNYIFQDPHAWGGDYDEQTPSMHIVESIRHVETQRVYSPPQFFNSTRTPYSFGRFLGVQRPQQDGFELHDWSQVYKVSSNHIAVVADRDETQSLKGARLDLFALDGPASLEHVETTMTKLKQQTQGEQLLGALMFTCNGRGPEPGFFLQESTADARRFQKEFPTVPCVGFYAGGEIGPLAMARKENVFQTGKVALQGFTAVFAVFVVPQQKIVMDLDDSPDNVRRFVQERLGAS